MQRVAAEGASVRHLRGSRTRRFARFFLSGRCLSLANGLGQVPAGALASTTGPLGAAAIERRGEVR